MEKAGQMNATIYSLLDQAKTILELRKQRKERPGERFNVFTVLNMETDKVNTHSRLLYEFLRPDGSHGMGDQFLRIFFSGCTKKGLSPGRQRPGFSRKNSIGRRRRSGPHRSTVGRQSFLLPHRG